MYVCMNIKCGSMSPFLNLVHRFKLYKCKLTVKSVCTGDPHDPPLLTLCPLSKWGGVCWYYWDVFVFCFLIWSCLFFFFFYEDRRVCGSALWNVHVLWSCFPPPPSCPLLLPGHNQPLLDSPPQELVSLSRRIALNDDATQPHFRNKSVCLWVSRSDFLSIPSFLKQVLCSLAFLPLAILCVTRIKCFIRELISW